MSLRRAWSMEFRSVGDMELDLYRLLPALPSDISLVVGIPRSGLLPATLLSLHLNTPLTDISGLHDGRVFGAGMRSTSTQLQSFPDPGSTILIVDDSVGRGVQLRRVQDQLAPLEDTFRLRYAVVYSTPDQRHLVDFAASVVPARRVFAWNVMHHPTLAHSCVQFEELLADVAPMSAPPTIAAARRRFSPDIPVHTIIARQDPAAGPAVQAWLEQHGVAFRALAMVGTSKEDDWIRAAAATFRRSNTNLFVTADAANARRIARRAGMPVLSLPSATVHQPSPMGELRILARRAPNALRRRMLR